MSGSAAGPSVPPMARVAGIASAVLFVLYLALGLQVAGLVGQLGFLSKDLQSAQSTATVIGVLIGIAGLYESSLAYKGRLGALVALTLFHLLAGVVLAKLRSPSSEAAQVVGGMFGGALAMVNAIEILAFLTSALCVIAIVTVARVRAAPAAPIEHAQEPAATVATRDRGRFWWIAGAALVALAAVAIVAAKVGKTKPAAAATILVEDSGYAISDGCTGGAEQCAGAWHPISYYRTGDMIFSGPCWNVCTVGEHARPVDMRDIDMTTIRCVPGTYYRPGMSSCKVTFQRRRPAGSAPPPPPAAPPTAAAPAFVDEDEDLPALAREPAPGSAGAAVDVPHAPPAAPAPAAPARMRGAPTIDALIDAEHQALATGDPAQLGSIFDDPVFTFGLEARDEAGLRDDATAMLRRGLGSGPAGFKVTSTFQHVGVQGDSAWIAEELDIAAPDAAPHHVVVTSAARHTEGGWLVLATHWSVPLANATAYERAKDGRLATPAAIDEAPTEPELLDAASGAFSSRGGFISAVADRADAFNLGSAPGERLIGGATIMRVFGRMDATIKLHDGIAAGRLGAGAGWAAANVDFTVTRDGATITETYRVLAVLVEEGGQWRVVQAHWSNGT